MSEHPPTPGGSEPEEDEAAQRAAQAEDPTSPLRGFDSVEEAEGEDDEED
jgi:hypothetical protein